MGGSSHFHEYVGKGQKMGKTVNRERQRGQTAQRAIWQGLSSPLASTRGSSVLLLAHRLPTASFRLTYP